MSIFWCIVWGILVAIMIRITMKYYLPVLSSRTQISASEAHTNILGNRGTYRNILVACLLFTVLCGYFASMYSSSVLNLLKMTLTFVTLACIFVIDIELRIIPNLCSIILLIGRILTIIYEFIWMGESAMPWLINSAVAAFISLLFLLAISKVTKGGIGIGDIKIFSAIGFMCGINAICFTLVLSFLTCAIVSTVFLLTKKKKLKDSLPLGPFIWIGYGISILLSVV